MKALLLALLLTAPMMVSAQGAGADSRVQPASKSAQATQEKPQGQIESAVAVADPMFGVHANVLGLERRVEMLQWRKLDFPAPPHYEQAWSAERIDSSAYDSAHKNSGDLPFNGERWWSSDPKLDDHPVSADVMSALDAWTPLKPDLSQLPTNLAVSFQPDGDWLSTSQDPAHPQVGDVRVRWRAIVHAPAPRGATLVAGHWQMPAAAVAEVKPVDAASQPSSNASSGAMQAWMQRMFGDHLAWWVVGGFALALVLLIRKRRR